MILVLHEVSHVSFVLHQNSVYFLEGNEDIHGVEEGGGEHAENADNFKVVNGIWVKHECFASQDLVVAWLVFSYWTEEFLAHSKVGEETHEEADDAVSCDTCHSHFREAMRFLHLVLDEENVVVSVKESHGNRNKGAELEKLCEL